jgi:N4-gp56 family major capsid protein
MADMGKTEVDAAVMEQVSQFVQAELKQRALLMPTVQNFPAPGGIDKIKIPRAGGFTAATKAENTALTAQVITFATDDLDLDQHKAVLARLEDFANIQATPNVVQEILGRMASEMALAVDQHIVTCLDDVSAAAPDHAIVYDNATDLKKADLLNARELLHVQNVPFEECWIGVSPANEASLLAVDDFVQADKYGRPDGLQRGVLGTLYGARVIMSNVFDDAKTLVWHPTHCAFAMQQEIRFETDRDLPNVATEYLSSAIYGCKVLDSGKRGVLLGSATP